MSTQPVDGTELPADLVAKPLALIGITGLDTINNAIHRSIWDAFGNNRRPDRAPVHFKLLSNAHEFPINKPKRNSYEWYIPKGILKKNWLNKHLNLVPAVIVVFYDMDWNDIQWNEKIIECASRVQSMRAVTEGHFPRLVVVVIQNTAPLSPSEDVVGAERAQALCAACEIQSKALFVLPHGDHLMGYAIRLENAFYDLAQQYYHHEIRNIKAHRDHLNKTTHQYLFVRHQFKMGFIYELKQDINTAQKHYLHAYNNLLEVRIVDTNALEVKTVAGYINYKLCKLLFNLNQPRDAIAQLRSHIERYCNKVGIRELAFEHHAWMARQYSVFGELFDEAIRGGLPAIQTQHPGFYYQQAAQCATQRRQACQILCSDTLVYPQPDPLQGTVEFYGQHVWRPGKLITDPSDPQKEKEAIKALQFTELHHVNHSMIIISLLGSAIAQFKTYRCPRMRRHLLVQMAQEYYTCSDYGKSLTLLMHMLWDYRKEKWWYLVSLILNRALACAYLTANIQDYIALAIEALGKNISIDGDKKRIYDNLLTLLNGGIPEPEPNISDAAVQNAIEQWKLLSDKDSLPINIDMSMMSSCIEAKARFTENKYQVDSNVTIELFIRVLTPAPLQLDRVSVCVNNPHYSCEFAVCEKESSPTLLLKGGEVKKFLCQFVPDPQDVGRNLQIASISLQLGKSNGRHAILQFNGAGGMVSGIFPEIFHYRMIEKEIPNFESIQPLAISQIIPRESKMSVVIEQADPALLGEWFPVTINLMNEESTNAHHIQLSLNLMSSIETLAPDTSVELCFNIEEKPTQLPLLLSIGTLNSHSNFKKVFYLRSNKVISTTVLMKITYDITTTSENKNESNIIMENKSADNEDTPSDKKKMACFKEHSIKITVVKPFDITSKYVTMRFEDIDKCFYNDPFIAMPQAKVLSPWPIVILDSHLEVSEHFEKIDKELPSCLKNMVIEENVITNEAVCIKAVTNPDSQPVTLGTYTLYWKRKSSELSTTSKTTMAIVAPYISSSWLRIEIEFPSHGCLRNLMPFTLRFHSTAACPHTLLLRVEEKDYFMFAGHKQCTISILPESTRELVFNFFPLMCGSISPPRFHLSPVESLTTPTTPDQHFKELSSEYLQELIDRSVPSRIYIMPQEKPDSSLDKKFSSIKIDA